MRVLLIALIATLSIPLSAQPVGTYRQEGSQPVSWAINEHHALIWGPSPYLPVGIRTDGSAADLALAKQAGLTDLLIELPASGAGWDAAIKGAEDGQFRYLLCMNSLAPMSRGYAVEPQGYRIAGITVPTKIQAKLHGATSALAVLVTRRDMAVERTFKVDTPDGNFALEVKPANDLEHMLLIYPDMTSLVQVDYWEGFDDHRDALLAALKRTKFGKGIRGIVNPIGTTIATGSQRPQFVPSGAHFRAEYRSHLKNKYRDIDTLQRAWFLTVSDLESFDDLSRLVPLWSGQRGVMQFWDPKTDKLYGCDSRRSAIWEDIQTVVSSAVSRRYHRLVRAIRQIVDVPVVQEWNGWIAPYEADPPSVNGVGMRVSGTSPSLIAEAASRATSAVLRWKERGWLLATSIDMGSAKDQVALVTDDLANLGARGWFFAADPALMPVLKAEAAKRTTDQALAQWSPKGVFFPENATNPAMPLQLPGGHWWLPAPASGNRIDLGSRFFAYRYKMGNDSFTALWTSGPPTRVKIRLVDPVNVSFRSLDGSDPKPKLYKQGVEVVLGEYPLLILNTEEIPIPEPAFEETALRFDQLLKLAVAEAKDVSEENFFFRDAIAGFDRNPSGSFATLRNYFWKLNAKMGRYGWVEAETSREHNFSEAVAEPGASGGNVLSLRTAIGGKGAFFANLSVPVRTDQEQEVWLAARISPEQRDGVRVTIGSQVLQIQGEPVSRYGAGFGWYRLGTITMRPGYTRARISVDSSDGADLAIDSLLLAPGNFRPMGTTQPDAIVFAPIY